MSTDRECLISVNTQLATIQAQIMTQLGIPVPPPNPNPPDPNPPIPPTPPHTYPGPDMWLYANNRRKVNLTPGQVSRGGFTVPASYGGIVEFPISGAGFNILVDGIITSSDGRIMAAGPHTYDAELVTGAPSAEGSIAVAHS